MTAGAKYGFFLAIIFIALTNWAPQPAGSIVLWSAITIETAVLERIVWKRLRLPWFAAGGVAALIACAAMVPISTRGLDMFSMSRFLPAPLFVLWWICWLLVPLTLGIEALRGSREWRAWSEHMEHVTLRDMLALRHIPNLHNHA